jgi:2-dehydro-3-deoxyglucarate aldolase/4-hydroxy-2-oxoheptanedioate aldolase
MKNRNLKAKLQKHELALGMMLSEVTTPNIMRIIGATDVDYVIIDCEHGYFDLSQVAALVGISNGIGLPVIIRIPEIRREVITKFMDMGADGLLVPMTNTPEDIKTVVQYSKYSPLGERGISTQRAHTGYSPPPLQEYMKDSNARTIILAQIETCEAVGNIERIIGIEGVDAAVIGPNDMSCNCEKPGDYFSEIMQKNINSVVAAAASVGKPSGVIASNINLLAECYEKGMRVFSCNSEVGILLKGIKQMTKEFSEAINGG